MTECMLKCLNRQIRKYPAMMAVDLKETVPELAPVAERTISHHLRNTLKLPSRSAAQKPLLKSNMVKKRMAFCRKY